MEKLLIINGGSSSMKFNLIEKQNSKTIASGIAERIFIDGLFVIKINDEKFVIKQDLNNHDDAINLLLDQLIKHKLIQNLSDIKGVGHRVVQGGELFPESILINQTILKQIRELGALAPLHNPGEADIIESFMKIIPEAQNVAVFDTSFHSTMPEVAFKYAVPEEWYSKYKVRRYGMHGTSHKYISNRMEKELNKKPNIISCHLGNGASICAIKDGKSINTSMGLTPLAGLIMGTRSGDIDPSIFEYIHKQTGASLEKITYDLNNNSGLKSLSGGSSDFRDIRIKAKNGDIKAQFTIKAFVARVATYIVDYANQIGNNIDGIIFTAGIGENSDELREMIIKSLPILNLELSNKNSESYNDLLKISSKNSAIDVFVIRTDEESLILEDLIRLMK